MRYRLGYGTFDFRGQTRFRCLECSFDSYSETAIGRHLRVSHQCHRLDSYWRSAIVRYNPQASYIVARGAKVNGTVLVVGDPVPEDWSPRLIEKMLRTRVVRIRPPKSESPLPEVTSERPIATGVSVVVLSCYQDIFGPLCDQFNRWEPSAHKVLVTSGSLSSFTTAGWECIPGIEPFCFGRNANIGIRACGTDDVFLVNDDVRLHGPILARLRELAYLRSDVAVLAPQVAGGVGNLTQSVATRIKGDLAFPTQRLAYVAVYFKRATFDRVGLFDERYTGYGSEDSDEEYRIAQAGLKSAVTPHVVVTHGTDGAASSSSFLRQMTRAERAKSMLAMRKLLTEKWGRDRWGW